MIKLSNSAIGTAFELSTLNYLINLKPPIKLTLLKVGGSNDRGIDLRGWWEISTNTLSAATSTSTLPTPIPQFKSKIRTEIKRRNRWSVLVQCKCESKSIGPNIVRELEGTLAYELDNTSNSKPISERGDTKLKSQSSTIGILVSQKGFSKEALLRADTSTFPISLVELDFRPVEGSDENNLVAKLDANKKPVYSSITFNPALKRLLGMIEIVDINRKRSLSNGKDLTNVKLLIVPEEGSNKSSEVLV